MAISGGPDIVEDGLVLHLDAAEPLCFRGEPTTNLASYTNGNASRGSWPYGSYTHSIETTGEFAGWEKIVATSVGSATSNYVMYIGSFSPTSGVQYTGSIEFYSPYNNLMFEITGGQGIGSATRIGSSNKYYRTFATSISTNMAWYLRTIASTPANTAITNGVIYYRRAQFEQKPYYTDFTIGTRGSTVATGGGLLDLTNNGNNGEINRTSVPSAAFYSGNNSGSFVFDGSNDYVSVSPTSINSNITNSITLNCWVKVNSTSYQVIGGGQDNTGTRYTMSFNCNESLSNTYGFDLEATSGQVRLASASNSLVLNTWVNLIGTYDGSTAKFYLNSSLVDTDTGTSGNIVDFDNIIFGRDISPGRYLNGNIAQFSIYNRALSANEVRQNFEATKGRYGL